MEEMPLVKITKVERGDRWYNGIPCELMNDLYDNLILRYGSIDDLTQEVPAFATMSLYLCRACNVLERKGWRKDKNESN